MVNNNTAITNIDFRNAKPERHVMTDMKGCQRPVLENRCNRSSLEIVILWDGVPTSVHLDRTLGIVDEDWKPIPVYNDAKAKIEDGPEKSE